MAARKTPRSGGGMSLRARFAIAMSIALAVVVPMANYAIYQAANKSLEEGQRQVLRDAAYHTAIEKEAGREPQIAARATRDGHVVQADATFGPDDARVRGYAYRVTKDMAGDEIIGDTVLVPASSRHSGAGMLRLMGWLTLLVIIVGAIVSVVVSGGMTRPLEFLVEDVRHLARGNLSHRTRVRGGGEVASVARAIDRMATELKEAQDAELELSAREREMEVAGEVREALLPQETPVVEGYEVSGLHVESEQSGGTFHDFIECDDGALGILVCDVSGLGLPGALVGATARSYLRSELARTADVEQALQRVNRQVAGDMRRGMYVTALYLRVAPGTNRVQVASAGHKLPLVRCSADGSVRLAHPEGIALGFDKGPVFDRALQVQELELEAGDRLVLAGAVAAGILNPDGEELGEKAFYSLARKMSKFDVEGMLDAMVTAIETYADGEPFPSDLSIVAVGRIA